MGALRAARDPSASIALGCGSSWGLAQIAELDAVRSQHQELELQLGANDEVERLLRV